MLATLLFCFINFFAANSDIIYSPGISKNFINSSFVGYSLVLTTLPSTIVTGRTSTPSSTNILFIVLLSINAFGSLERLYLSTLTPFFSNLFKSVDTLKRFLSTDGPQTPVEQHIAGSNISIFFILYHPFTLYSCLYSIILI